MLAEEFLSDPAGLEQILQQDLMQHATGLQRELWQQDLMRGPTGLQHELIQHEVLEQGPAPGLNQMLVEDSTGYWDL